ncbi:MAG: HAD-IA family hydrolase [Patescibacteria group bacterium]|jgi:phosphoglycolate phosphatase
MKKIKYIIFDFDGTIADTLPFSFQKFLEIAHMLHLDDLSERQIIKEIRSKSYQELLKGSFNRAWLKLPYVIKMIKDMQIELEKEMNNIKFFPGVKKFLYELKDRGYKLAIISSNRVENINKFIEFNKLNIFDFIHGKTDLFGKAGYLKKFLKDYRLKKNEVIYIGDEIRDVEACKKVGIKIIGVSWGMHTADALEKAKVNYIIKKPSEFFKIISK